MANGDGKQSATVSQSEINGILWKACDTFRGAVDPSEYKNYILVMLFVKYISDVWQDHYDKVKAEFGENEERILRRLKRERFVLPPTCTFQALGGGTVGTLGGTVGTLSWLEIVLRFCSNCPNNRF
jgi:type I restriction enzyme M protein